MDTSTAIERLVRDYGERAYHFAYRLTGSVEESRDMVQEAYRRVLKGWDRYDDSQPLENWFFTVLRNVVIDAERRCAHACTSSLDVPAGADEDSSLYDVLEGEADLALEALERQESSAAVRRALQGLSVEHRAALTLCDLEAFSYEEIARVLGCPLGTVRSRVNRARGALRKRLAREPVFAGEWSGR